MNQQNSYTPRTDYPSNRGVNWPRVTSRAAFQQPPYYPNRGAAARKMHTAPPPPQPVEPDDNYGSWSNEPQHPQQQPQRQPAPVRRFKSTFNVQSTLSEDPTVPSYARPGDYEDDEVTAQSTPLERADQRGEVDRAFPAVFADQPFLQLPQSNLIVNPVPQYLTIDSRDRNRLVWPNSNEYRIPLVGVDNKPEEQSPNVRYRNIYSISLLSAVIPNTGNVLAEPYLLLQIDEIDGMYDSANPPSARAFTKLYFKEVCNGSTYLRLDKGVGDPMTKIYWPAPRASLDTATVSFRRYDGSLFDFGADSVPPTAPLSDRQTSITLEIRTFVVDAGKAIGTRQP